MDSTSIYKYRVKKKWKLNSSGDKEAKYYPQYNRKFIGWGYTYKYVSTDKKLGSGALLLSVINMVMMVIYVIWFLIAPNLISVSLFLIASFLEWLIYYFDNNRIDEYISEFNTLDKGKAWISKRIGELDSRKRKKEKKKKNSVDIPEDEVFYLDLKIERTEKLKKINRNFKWFRKWTN